MTGLCMLHFHKSFAKKVIFIVKFLNCCLVWIIKWLSLFSPRHAWFSFFKFSMPQTSLEMARMEGLMNIPEDSVPCKVRAKRGCATHPRSIAERVSFMLLLRYNNYCKTVIYKFSKNQRNKSKINK